MPRNPYYQGPVSDHFDGKRFFNPDHPPTDHGLRDLLRWRLGESHAPWTHVPATTPAHPAPREQALTVTLVGHASVLIQFDGLNLLVDPVWSERASPLRFAGPKRWNPPAIALDALPPIDAVLVTHNHYDHLDLRTLARLHQRFAPRIIAPLGNDAIITRAGAGIGAETLDWWQSLSLSSTHELTVVPANHWSSRGVFDRRMALWGGFYLRSGDVRCYIAGDTGYGNGNLFRAIGQRMGAPELAILPIGAYAPRWFMRPQHMDAAEAVQAMCGLGAAHAVGMHWGTFQLTDEPVMEPKELLLQTLSAQGIAPERFIALAPGEGWTRRRPRPSSIPGNAIPG